MTTSKSNANPTRGADTKPPVKHAERAQTANERGPGVAPEERQRLAECCAFFKAAHYRHAEPGTIRKRDIETAQAEIDAVLKNCGKK
jgi:hypothetical protein